MDDRKILKLLLARAEDAIEAMAVKFGWRLTVTARHILGDWQEAEESVNDTYLAVWNAVPPKEPDPLSGFVFKTGRNLALKRLRCNTALLRDSSYTEIMDFILDRPFLFVIASTEGVPLFTGVVNEP